MGNKNSISPAETSSEKEEEKAIFPYGYVINSSLKLRIYLLIWYGNDGNVYIFLVNSVFRSSAFALFALQSDLGAAQDPSQEAFELLQVLQVVNSLPSENKSLEKFSDVYHDVYLEELKIIKKLRDMANHLAKIHGDVLIADRVGTGVGIGGGVLTIGGLLAAPFTAGLSLGFSVTGVGAGILGGGTSIGANITGYCLLKYNLKKLAKDAECHNSKVEELLKLTENSMLLKHASRFRPSLEMLIQISQSEFLQMLTTIQKMVQLALDGSYDTMKNHFPKSEDPKIMQLLRIFGGNLDPQLLRALADVVAQLLSQFRSIYAAIKAAFNYLQKPELTKMAMLLCSLNPAARATTVTAREAAEVTGAFKGTALAMSKNARFAAAAFSAAFIVVDVIHMVRICQETGETPTVQKLRSLADDLERDLLQNQSEQNQITL